MFWFNKTANILNALPKSVQPKAKESLYEIWISETRKDAENQLIKTLMRFEEKYLGAMKRLSKNKHELLAFYDFPSEHWIYLRTTNLIESTFATVRL